MPRARKTGTLWKWVSGTLLLLFWPTAWSGAAELHLFAGAGLRQPVDALVGEFQRATGNTVVIDYAGSGQQLARIQMSGVGDLFMPGSLLYIRKLEEAGAVQSCRRVVAHTPVVGVNRRRAETIRTFEDLAQPGLRLALGDPKAMALGRTAMEILENSGLKEAVLKNVVVFGATVKQLALYVAQGEVDASIIGRADAFQFKDDIVMIPIPEKWFKAEIIGVAVLGQTKYPREALELQDFLSSARAVETFERFGFLALPAGEAGKSCE